MGSLQVSKVLHHAPHILQQPLDSLARGPQGGLEAAGLGHQIRVGHDGVTMDLRFVWGPKEGGCMCRNGEA